MPESRSPRTEAGCAYECPYTEEGHLAHEVDHEYIEAAAPRPGEGLDVDALARAWYAAVDEPEDGPWEDASDAAVDNAKAWAIAIAAEYAKTAAAPREASE